MSTFRFANPTEEEAAALADLVQRAYFSEVGWSTEVKIRGGKRVDAETVLKTTRDLEARVIVAERDGAIIGCCEIALQTTGDAAYFSLFAVEPGLQTAGLGRAILAEAEERAKEVWGVASMQLMVIAQQEKLIRWYQRRGYTKTGLTRAFDLHFVLFRKTISR